MSRACTGSKWHRLYLRPISHHASFALPWKWVNLYCISCPAEEGMNWTPYPKADCHAQRGKWVVDKGHFVPSLCGILTKCAKHFIVKLGNSLSCFKMTIICISVNELEFEKQKKTLLLAIMEVWHEDRLFCSLTYKYKSFMLLIPDYIIWGIKIKQSQTKDNDSYK